MNQESEQNSSQVKWQQSDRQVSSAVSGEFVLMGLHNSMYYGLKETGSRIWELLAEPVSAAEIVDVLLEEYDVARERCEGDVKVFLQKLADQSLISKNT